MSSDADQIAQAESLVREGRLIEGVKLYRYMTGATLKEGRDWAVRLTREYDPGAPEAPSPAPNA